DSVLAGGEQRQRAAIALAGQAARLTAGGLTEIVVADPLPRSVLTTADPERLRQELDSMAIAAGREAPAKAHSATSPAAEKAATAARLAQLDRLTVEMASRGGGGARALILPVGSWPLAPESLARLTSTPSTARAEASGFGPLQETSRALAGYGWVTVPLALRARRDETEPSAAERRTQVTMGGGGDQRTTVPIVSISGKEEAGDPTTTAQVATLTDFSLMPYAILARPTSGALVGDRDRLQSTLADLLHRRQFTYRSPFPQPGRLMALEVRWKGGDGRELGAQRWLRSSAPPEVAAARLRRLLAGDSAPQVPATAAIQWSTDSRRVCFPGEGEKRWVRLSGASEKNGAIQIVSGEPFQIERGADGLCAPAPSAVSGVVGARTASLAEDLENETWTGAVSSNN
ncbi:MAG: hypothetical protein ABIV06_07985, partial [Thermoanaerobaculia bacterium]